MSNKAAYVRLEVANGQSRPHTCHARGCNRHVPPAYFMCAKHWRMVPRDLQAAVWRHYQPGQEKGDADVTEAYCQVTDEAIDAVAAKEEKGRSSSAAPSSPSRNQLTLDDLSPHDRRAVERLGDFVKAVQKHGKTPEGQQKAYAEVYGGEPRGYDFFDDVTSDDYKGGA